MCRVVAAYLQGLRAAWLRGVQPGHDDDTELTRVEEEREVLEPQLSPAGYSPPAGVGRAAAPPPPQAGVSGGHPNPLTACAICGETLVCRQAALEWIDSE